MKQFFGPRRIGCRVLCLIISIFFLTPIGLAADFSDTRRSFVNDLEKVYGSKKDFRLAIVYNKANQNTIKYKINLIKFKQDLSRELLRSFQVVDPLIVQEIIATNQISYSRLTEDDFILTSFAERADCTHVLLVDIKTLNVSVLADMKLISPSNEMLSQVVMDIPREASGVEVVEELPPPVETSDDSIMDRFAGGYTPSEFDNQHNESWLFFSPTAYTNPRINYLDILAWVDDLGEVDIKVTRLRYELSAMKKLIFGAEINTIQEKQNARTEEANTEKGAGIHSGYISARYQVLDKGELPVTIMLGVRGRAYWDKYNTDFKSDDDKVDKQNDDYNKVTLFTSISGKWDSVGLLYNFHLTNQAFSVGARYLITSDIKLYAEQIVYYYQKPQVPTDLAVGIQAFNSDGLITTIGYQKETDQIQFGLSFSW